MSEVSTEIPPYVEFNDLVVENLVDFISLCTYDMDFDLLDTVIYTNPGEYLQTDHENFMLVTEWMSNLVGAHETEQKYTVYRSLHFAKIALVIMGQYEFITPYGLYNHELRQRGDVAEVMLGDVATYFETNDSLRGLLKTFADDLDTSEDGRNFDLVARTLGVTWLLGDRAMYQKYSERIADSVTGLIDSDE